MGAHGGPNIVRGDELGVIIDPSSVRGIKSAAETNILDYSVWVPGNTSATGFSRNGGSDENILEVGTGPFGESTVLWAGRNNTISSDSDGGWNSSQFTIDNTYMYRFSTWVYRQVTGNGSFYLGTRGYDANGANVGVLRMNSTLSNNTNPYFWSGGLNSSQGWQLVVGHVWPAGTGYVGNHINSGFYNTSGTKVGNISYDYIWNTTNVRALHRTYLYYSTDPSTVQLWAYPRVDKIDGTEPSIQDLINADTRAATNLKNPSQKFYLANNIKPVSASTIAKTKVKKLAFDATNDYIKVTGTTPNSLQRTIEMVVRVNGANATYMPIAVYTREAGGVEAGQRIWLGVQNNRFQMHGWGTNDPQSSSVITDGQWHHVVYAHNASTKYHYMWVNGVLESNLYNTESTGLSGWANSVSLFWWLGHDPQQAGWTGSASAYFNGDIGIFKTYSKVLSNNEVLKNFKAYKKRFNIS